MRVLNLNELTLVSGGKKSDKQKAMEASCKSDINNGASLAGGSGAALGAAVGSTIGPVGTVAGTLIGGSVGALVGMVTAIGSNKDCKEIVKNGKNKKK